MSVDMNRYFLEIHWPLRRFLKALWEKEKMLIRIYCTGATQTNHRLLTTLGKKPFENIEGKGENVSNQHFLFYQPCFLPCQGKIAAFTPHWKCRLRMISIWARLEFCRLVKRKNAFSHSVAQTLLYYTRSRIYRHHVEGKKFMDKAQWTKSWAIFFSSLCLNFGIFISSASVRIADA